MMRSMDSEGAVEGSSHRAICYIGAVRSTDLVKAYCVAADLRGLTDLSHLDVGEATYRSVGSW